MAEKNSLWKNIRNKAKQNRESGATPKKPTTEMLRQERQINAEKYDKGGKKKSIPRLLPVNEQGLPYVNLKGVEITAPEMSFEDRLDKYLGYPMQRSSADARLLPAGEDELDNVRHPLAGLYTANAIKDKLDPYMPSAIATGAGFVGSTAAGIGHEMSTMFGNDTRPWSVRLREAGEDIFNNTVGAGLSTVPFMSDQQKKDAIIKASYNNMLPDGYGDGNMYFKADGGLVGEDDKNKTTTVRDNTTVTSKSLEEKMAGAVNSANIKAQEQKEKAALEQERVKLRKFLDGSTGSLQNWKDRENAMQRLLEIDNQLGTRSLEKEIKTLNKAGRIMLKGAKYFAPELAPVIDGVENWADIYQYSKDPSIQNATSLGLDGMSPIKVVTNAGRSYRPFGVLGDIYDVNNIINEKAEGGYLPTQGPGKALFKGYARGGYMYPGGGYTLPSGLDPTKATRQDSLMIYNNALDKLNFYKGNTDYLKNTTDPGTNFKDAAVRKQLIDKVKSKSIKKGVHGNTTKVNKELVNGFITNAAMDKNPVTPEERKKLNSQIGKTRFESIPNTNVTSFGDVSNSDLNTIFNPMAPPIYLNPDIEPQGSETYYSKRWGDVSDVPYYDPIAVAPFDILKPEQQIERLDKYGPSGIPQSYIDSRNKISTTADVPIEQVVTEEPQVNTEPFKPSRVILREMGNVQRYNDGQPHNNTHEVYMDDKKGWRPISNIEREKYLQQYPGANESTGWTQSNKKATGGYTNPYNQYQDDPYNQYANGGYMYGNGGWKKFGNTMADIGLGIGDVALGSIGSVTGIKSMQDIVDERAYHNDDFDTGANFVGKLAGTALKYIPVTAPFAAAAGVVGGVANAAVGIDKKFYDPTKHQQDLDKAGDIINFAGDVGTMFVDPSKAAKEGASKAKTIYAASDAASKVGEAGKIVDTAATTTDAIKTASNIAETAKAATNVGEAVQTGAQIASTAAPVVDSANKLSSGLKYGQGYYNAVENVTNTAGKIGKYGTALQTLGSVAQPMMQQQKQQETAKAQKSLTENTMGTEPMYPKPDANAAYAGINVPTFNTGVPQVGGDINTYNPVFSQGGNITNNSLNLHNTMRYKRFAQGGTFDQYGINMIPDSAGLHHESAYGGVPIGPNALAEGGEIKMDIGNGSQYIVSDQVDGTESQKDFMFSKGGKYKELNRSLADGMKQDLKKYSMGNLATSDRVKDDLRRPNESWSSIDQVKKRWQQKTEYARQRTQQDQAIAQAQEQKKMAEEQYIAAYGGKINPKKYPGLNMTKRANGGYVHNQMTQPMYAQGGPIYGDPASPYTYGEGGIDDILAAQPITYKTDAGQPRQQMNWAGMEPGMPRPNVNPAGVVLDAEEPREKYTGDRLTIGGEGTYKREKATPVEEGERVDLNSPVFKNAINASLNGGLNLGRTGDFKVGANATLNYATPVPEEGGANMLRRNPGVTGTVGGNIAYDKNGNAFNLGVNYNPVENTTEGTVKFTKTFPTRKARGGQIDYTNDMYSMYAGGGPMVSNVNQPFNGPSAQNRGGMYLYPDGGMMPPEQQMMQEQQMQQQAPQEEMQQQPDQEQMMQMVQQAAQMLEQGAQPEQVMQQLVQAGVPQDMAMQAVQMAMQEMQGQMQQQGQEQPMQGQEQMMPPQGMANGGIMYYGGGNTGGPGTKKPVKKYYTNKAAFDKHYAGYRDTVDTRTNIAAIEASLAAQQFASRADFNQKMRNKYDSAIASGKIDKKLLVNSPINTKRVHADKTVTNYQKGTSPTEKTIPVYIPPPPPPPPHIPRVIHEIEELKPLKLTSIPIEETPLELNLSNTTYKAPPQVNRVVVRESGNVKRYNDGKDYKDSPEVYIDDTLGNRKVSKKELDEILKKYPGADSDEGWTRPAKERTPQATGGMMPSQDGMASQIAQELQQGAQPQQVLQKLVEQGMPQEQAMSMVQAIMSQLQNQMQQQPQQQQQMMPQEQMAPQQPMMARGGYFNGRRQYSGMNVTDPPVIESTENTFSPLGDESTMSQVAGLGQAVVPALTSAFAFNKLSKRKLTPSLVPGVTIDYTPERVNLQKENRRNLASGLNAMRGVAPTSNSFMGNARGAILDANNLSGEQISKSWQDQKNKQAEYDYGVGSANAGIKNKINESNEEMYQNAMQTGFEAAGQSVKNASAYYSDLENRNLQRWQAQNTSGENWTWTPKGKAFRNKDGIYMINNKPVDPSTGNPIK